ncbi:MAG: hypothetical protein RMK73_12580 [Geminicoccaceae bacterium]|nr:hypothetical protein [Geminicoccaceae bacterium]MDW8125606.1 hypothetical protein [Geminicoccaceae bacterium]MDW8342311.1 hypothetical protein [Geminicoccaceae bacterium]
MTDAATLAAGAAAADPAFEALRAAWRARFAPADAAEEVALENLVAALWRRHLLDRVEERVLRALAEGKSAEGCPSLDSLARYAARLAKEIELARARFFGLRNERRTREREGFAEPASERGRAEACIDAPARQTREQRTSLPKSDRDGLAGVMRELFRPEPGGKKGLRDSVSPLALDVRAA